MYSKYSKFLDGTANQELENFFKEEEQSLVAYGKVREMIYLYLMSYLNNSALTVYKKQLVT